ncbi:MAG: oligosaccharide flippase family protein [Eubacterium sp.]
MTEKKGNSIATDSFLLIFVRCITMMASIVQSMVLARTLSKSVFGTYSQALLIISLIAPFLSIGLDNSINYFFNKTDDLDEKKKYINTIMGLSFIIGIIGGFMIILSQQGLVRAYNNQALAPLVIYIAFRPCLQNLIGLYQPLYISSGYAKIIAVRNLIISVLQVTVIVLTAIFSENLIIIFGLLLVLDIGQLLFFAQYYQKHNFKIQLFKIEKRYIKSIIKYSVPMLLAIMVGTISINLDKLVVSSLMSLEDFALYSNMAKELPFSFVAASFTAVITPKIVQLLSRNEMEKFHKLWSDYLEIGYTITWILCVGAIIMAPEIIEILYSTKYLTQNGIFVFQIYTVVAMFRFTYFGLVPSAKGETKIVMYYSILGVVINLILNFPFFYLFGMIGPPIATLISLMIMAYFYFRKSTKLVGGKLFSVLRIKKMFTLFLEMFICGILVVFVTNTIGQITSNKIVLFIIGYGLFVGIMSLIKYKDIKKLIHDLNH